jgi:hypothetical protein
MATASQVLSFLIPNGGYVLVGDTYEGLTFPECEPITKEQFEAGFAQYDTWKTKQEEAKVTAKAAAEAKLEALGLTADDLKALGL